MWSRFEGHSELAFIDVIWLESYREKRRNIINRRLEEAAAQDQTLLPDERDEKEPTILIKEAITPIQSLMRKHRMCTRSNSPPQVPVQ